MLIKLRQNWLAAALLTVGFALRVLAVVSYRPVLFYIDTIRYLYDSGGNDPVGYRLPLRAILAVGNFDLVAIVQHLLGLAMAVTIYLVLVRRGTKRWLAALAIAPVLLDAYQIQMEQLVLPDVWFEALVIAGIAALLAGTPAAPSPAVRARTSPAQPPAVKAGAPPAQPSTLQAGAPSAQPPALKAVIAAGLIFGVSATFRQVGEILILPALFYLLMVSGGWRTLLTRTAALLVSFVVPILTYMTGSYLLVGHFYLSHSGVTTTYGRTASAADCATLRLPPVERGLCPARAQQALGPDWLEHSPHSPIKPYYHGPLSARASSLVADFNQAVLSQQPTRVLGSYLADVGKVFALSKVTTPGVTPVWRWQFQTHYPYRAPHASPAQVRHAIAEFGGGTPAIWRPGATALRDYQLGGGYTPGPLLALCAQAGLAGSTPAVTPRYRELRSRRHLALASQHRARSTRHPTTSKPTTASSGAGLLAAPTPANDRTAPSPTHPETLAPSPTHPERTDTHATGPSQPERTDTHATGPDEAAGNKAAGDRAADIAAGADSGWRELALGCLLFFGCGAALLLMSDVFEFSWRYQLPALVTLPPAGAAVVAGIVRRRATGPSRAS